MIDNVDWQITAYCNRSCEYCFGPETMPAMDIENIYKCIDILSAIGIKRIGITGGEPLLHPYFEDIVNAIYKKGISIYLSTNCDFYFKYSALIKKKIDIIGVPLDDVDFQKNDCLRGRGSYDNVIKTLHDIVSSDSNIRIKVGTVITKTNVNSVYELAKIIAAYEEKIAFWKLYELVKYQRNEKNVANLCNNESIDMNRLCRLFNSAKIIYNRVEDRNKSYFFIKPNGDVFVPVYEGGIFIENKLGNIVTEDIKVIIGKFSQIVCWEGYKKEYRFIKAHSVKEGKNI